MSATTGLFVFLAAIIAAVVIGTKTKSNVGIAGIVFAFLIGTTAMGKSIAQVVNYWPTSLLFMMMIVTFFYGYAAENGAIKGIADRLVYMSRNHLKLLPLILYFITFAVAAIGAGAGAAPVIMSPIVFDLVTELGFNPVLAILALSLGSLAGGIQAWTSSGILFKGIAETFIGEELANASVWAYGVCLMVIPTLFVIICFLFLNRSFDPKSVDVKKPEPFTEKQKQTLWLIAAMMILVIVPVFMNMFVPNPATKWFTSKFDIKVLSAIGIVAASALNLADTRVVIKNRIPWGTIIMVCGMSTLISLAVETGIADMMGSWLGSNMPKFMIVPMVILLAGLLSFITTGPAVIFPLFIPMFPAISAATGISVVTLTAAVFAGSGATGMSPFSQGGAMAVTGCKDEKLRESLWSKQLLFAFIYLAFNIVVALLGVYTMICSIFA
ncbi:MAG: hypothetical protein K6D03_06855 [Solobacterium sp.]|nr:hypothetical protein [Solobacterium sp.]